MSNTFQFLDANQKQGSQDDAAQTFLNEKLSKNKYTQQQQDTLNASGGPTVANASAGFKPPGAANQDEIDAAIEHNKKVDIQEAESKWDGKNYSQGAFNADDLRSHFGLEDGKAGAGYNSDAGATDGDQSKDNDLLGKGYLSNERYNSLKNDSKVRDAYAALNGEEAAEKKFDGDGISINAMDSLFDDLTARASKEEKIEVAKKEVPKPIEHSPEIEQAKERVRSYEDDILSGKTSDDIYGSGADYSFDAAKGAAGIGTPMNGDSGQQASKATASFLDNKKSQVMHKYQFQPQT